MTRPIYDTDPLVMLRDMRQRLRVLVVATVLSYIVAGSIALFAWSLSATLHSGVCDLRGDLENRVENAREFLENHPKGAPQLGISRQEIVDHIREQDRTVHALNDGLGC
jgi:hypothetical protein